MLTKKDMMKAMELLEESERLMFTGYYNNIKAREKKAQAYEIIECRRKELEESTGIKHMFDPFLKDWRPSKQRL